MAAVAQAQTGQLVVETLDAGSLEVTASDSLCAQADHRGFVWRKGLKNARFLLMPKPARIVED